MVRSSHMGAASSLSGDFAEIEVEELFRLENPLLVDVRTPKEYGEDTIPGALNFPVLSNEERATVGRIYHQESARQARILGSKYFCQRIPSILDTLGAKGRGHEIVVFCWRGGMRSKALSTILSEVGCSVYRLNGGYKAYRQHVLSYLDNIRCSDRLVTIYGNTGSGKTQLLQILKNKGLPILDLEGLARHRGSSFGGVGLGPQPTQKSFDSRLFGLLRERAGGECLFLEGESRNVGQIILPERLYSDMREGRKIWIDTDREIRVRRIIDEYLQGVSQKELLDALSRIEQQLGGVNTKTCRGWIHERKYEEAVGLLLDVYYDPRYRHSSPDPEAYELMVDGNDLEEAATRIAAWSEEKRTLSSNSARYSPVSGRSLSSSS